MSITVDVRLLSGRTAAVKAGLAARVATLKRRAQTALGVGRGRLLDRSGNVLDECVPIKRARLQDGDSLTLQISRVQIQTSDFAIAALLGDGSVVTWGDAQYGGDNSAVKDLLKTVQRIQATAFAFAAILGDGSVVTWGADCLGGGSSAVQCKLG